MKFYRTKLNELAEAAVGPGMDARARLLLKTSDRGPLKWGSYSGAKIVPLLTRAVVAAGLRTNFIESGSTIFRLSVLFSASGRADDVAVRH